MSLNFGQEEERRLALLPPGWVNTRGQGLADNQTVSENSLTPCASQSASLITFAVVNLLTLLGAFILGRATFRSRITCGLLPGPGTEDTPIPHPKSLLRLSVFIPAIIMILLELISTIVGAYLAYGTGFMTLNAMIMMSLARPRGTWITIVVCYLFAKAMTKIGIIRDREIWMGNYQSSHFTMIVSEVLLEIIGVIPTVYLLSTITSSSIRQAIGDLDFHTKLMYIGAIVYVTGIAISTSLFGTALYMWIRKRLSSEHELSSGEGELLERHIRIVKKRRKTILFCVFAFGWIPALGSWMIWTGFVHVAKDFYCSKKLVEIAVVWIVCTGLRTFVGAG